MSLAFFLVGWLPSVAAWAHLWYRRETSDVCFYLWTLLLLAPWIGPIAYLCWCRAPLLTSVAMAALGAITCYPTARAGLEFAVSRDWQPVPLVSCDDNYEYVWDGMSTLQPKYTYEYRGARFAGARLSFLDPPWYASVWSLHCDGAFAYVDPGAPNESVLQRDIPPYERRRFLFALFELYALCAGCWLAWDQGRLRAPSTV